MGALFYRRVQPSEIIQMKWHELKYWYEWHLELVKVEQEAIKERK